MRFQLGVGSVQNMEQQFALASLLQGRFKGFNEQMRQPAYKAYGVGYKSLAAVGQPAGARERVQGSEQLILAKGVRAGQSV